MSPNFINSIVAFTKSTYGVYWARKRFLKLPPMKKPFFIIIMPGGLHLAYLAMRFIPDNQDKVVILNGVAAWECSWARRRIAATHYLEIPTVLRHSEILDLLFDTIPYDFGIIDYDCYVFHEQLFPEMTNIPDDCAINAMFFRNNPVLELDVPETFFLFFNTELINKIRSEYGVGAAPLKWNALPDKVQYALTSAGFSSECLPEIHKSYFDTLRVLMMLSRVEGVPYRFIERLPASPTPSETAFHVGGVSDPQKVKGIWDYRGSYFWYRVLELIDDEELHREYLQNFPQTTAAKLLNEQAGEELEIPKMFLEFCEHLIVTGLSRSQDETSHVHGKS